MAPPLRKATVIAPSRRFSAAAGASRMFRPASLGLLVLLLAGAVMGDEGPEAPASAVDRVAVEATYAFARALWLKETGEYEAASKAFDQALELDSTDAYAFIPAAEFYLEMGRMARSLSTQGRWMERAAELVDQALSLAPENRDVLRTYAEVYFPLGERDPSKLDKARAAYEVLAKDGDVQALTSLAQIHLWQGEPSRAADLLIEASNRSPRHRMIQSMLVDALLEADRVEEAEGPLRLLVELDPNQNDQRVRLAEVLSSRGAHDEAVGVLQAAPESYGDNSMLQRALARALHLAGRQQEALAASDSLIAAGLESLDDLRVRTAILASLARYHEAIDAFEPVLGTADDAEGRARDVLLMARLMERVGRVDEAASLLRRELASLDDDPAEGSQYEMVRALAGVLLRNGDPLAAVALIEPRVARAPAEEKVSLVQALATMWSNAGQPERGLAVVDDAVRTLEAGGELHAATSLRLGQLSALADAGSWQPLLDRLDQLGGTELPPETERGLTQLRAYALAGLGQVDAAVELLRTGDGTPELRAARLRIELSHGRESEALGEVETLVADGDPADLRLAASVLRGEGLFERAVPVLERLLEGDEPSPATLFAYGDALERTGRYEDAMRAFEQILESEPDDAAALNYLGYLWVERAQNLDHALDLILRAVAADPDNGAFVDSLGWAYFRLGRYDEAREHLEWASRLERQDPTVFHHLGDAYTALGRPDAARAAYQRALELDAVDPSQLNEESRAELRRKLAGR